MYKSSWGWTLGCSKHVEDTIIKLRLYCKKCAFCWFLLHRYITMHGSKNVNPVLFRGNRGSTVVKVLCYKWEGRWFDPSWCHWIFHWYKILPITLWPWDRFSLWKKWVPGEFPGGKGGRCVRLTTYHHPVPLSRNMGTLTSWNPLSHSRPVTGLLYLYYFSSRECR